MHAVSAHPFLGYGNDPRQSKHSEVDAGDVEVVGCLDGMAVPRPTVAPNWFRARFEAVQAVVDFGPSAGTSAGRLKCRPRFRFHGGEAAKSPRKAGWHHGAVSGVWGKNSPCSLPSCSSPSRRRAQPRDAAAKPPGGPRNSPRNFGGRRGPASPPPAPGPGRVGVRDVRQGHPKRRTAAPPWRSVQDRLPLLPGGPARRGSVQLRGTHSVGERSSGGPACGGSEIRGVECSYRESGGKFHEGALAPLRYGTVRNVLTARAVGNFGACGPTPGALAPGGAPATSRGRSDGGSDVFRRP